MGYDTDFYAWTREQAALLRAGQLAAADIDHIAEEIECMGRSEKRELVSRLTVLLTHLLKWQVQPERRGASWTASILNTRDELAEHLADNPSLRSAVPEAQAAAWRRGRRAAAAETGINEARLPEACPWRFDQVMDEEFWPGP